MGPRELTTNTLQVASDPASLYAITNTAYTFTCNLLTEEALPSGYTVKLYYRYQSSTWTDTSAMTAGTPANGVTPYTTTGYTRK